MLASTFPVLQEFSRMSLTPLQNVGQGSPWQSTPEYRAIADRKRRLGAALKARHPYETPIILHLPTAGADPDTVAWILAETTPDPQEGPIG